MVWTKMDYQLRLPLLLLAMLCTAQVLLGEGQSYQVSIQSSQNMATIPILTNVTLECQIQPLPTAYHYFEWTATNGYYSSRYTNRSSITIPWFRPENTGAYTCAVYLGNGAQLQSDTRTLGTQGNGLAISYPYFRKIESGTEVKVQGRVSVYCYHSGDLQSPIGWRYSNETVVPGSPLSFELKSDSNTEMKEYVLSTNKFSFSLLNKDRYICDLGSTENRLDVTLIPRSDVPTIVDAERGRRMYLPDSSEPWQISCTTDNDYSPEPSFTWLRDGNSIGDSSPWTSGDLPAVLNNFVSFGKTLTIYFDQGVDVSGVYTCSVHNGLGTDSATFLFEPTGPMVISKVSAETENLNVGDTMALEISASGTYGDIGWFLNGQLFAVWLSTDESTFFQCPDLKCRFEEFGKRLLIDGVTALHHGFYDVKLFDDFQLCNNLNSNGCGGELVTFTRNVYGPPAVFIVHDVSSSSDLRLICHVSGQPLPTITWKVNGTKILSDTRYSISQSGDNSVLLVQRPEWGRYSCEGINVNPYQDDSTPQKSSDTYIYGGIGEVVALETAPEAFSAATGALIGVVAMLVIIMAVLVAVIFFIRCSYREKVLSCSEHYFSKKKTQANQSSPYENTVINERDRENDYIMMKPARVSGSAIGTPLPSTPTSSIPAGHVTSLGTSPMMTSMMSSANVRRTSQMEEANV